MTLIRGRSKQNERSRHFPVTRYEKSDKKSAAVDTVIRQRISAWFSLKDRGHRKTVSIRLSGRYVTVTGRHSPAETARHMISQPYMYRAFRSARESLLKLMAEQAAGSFFSRA